MWFRLRRGYWPLAFLTACNAHTIFRHPISIAVSVMAGWARERRHGREALASRFSKESRARRRALACPANRRVRVGGEATWITVLECVLCKLPRNTLCWWGAGINVSCGISGFCSLWSGFGFGSCEESDASICVLSRGLTWPEESASMCLLSQL